MTRIIGLLNWRRVIFNMSDGPACYTFMFRSTDVDVKGVNTSGNIIQIKAIGSGRNDDGVRFISKEGELRDNKGVCS